MSNDQRNHTLKNITNIQVQAQPIVLRRSTRKRRMSLDVREWDMSTEDLDPELLPRKTRSAGAQVETHVFKMPTPVSKANITAGSIKARRMTTIVREKKRKIASDNSFELNNKKKSNKKAKNNNNNNDESEKNREVAQVNTPSRKIEYIMKHAEPLMPLPIKIEDVPAPESQNIVDAVATQLSNLKDILGTSYANVVGRMKLSFSPACFLNMEHCRAVHSKNSPNPVEASALQLYKSKVLFSHKSHFNALRMCEDMCYRNEFPGEFVLWSIIELILTTNENCDPSIPPHAVIQEAAILFRSLLLKFPPCWQAMRSIHERFLLSPVNMCSILPDTSNNHSNAYQCILSLLERTILDDSEHETDDTLNDSQNMFNYNEWEKKHNVHFFTVHSRVEKLDRLFIALDLVTRLLELDLALWILRHPSNPKRYIRNAVDQPLAMKLFGISEFNYKTQLVRQIIKLFVDCFSLAFPGDKIDILGRIISVLCTVINISETDVTSEGIRFPYIGTNTDNFAGEIFIYIDNVLQKKKRTIKKYISIFNHIKVPYIQYLLMDKLFSKYACDFSPLRPQKVFKNIRKRWWMEGRVESERKNEAATNCDMKYATYQPTARSFFDTEVYRQDCLDLMLFGLKAYCDSFFIPRVVKEVFRANSKPSQMDHANNNIQSDQTDISEKDVMRMRLGKPEIPSFNRIVTNSETLLYYREDVKYLMLLQEVLPKLAALCDCDFSQWNAYLNRLFLLEDGSLAK